MSNRLTKIVAATLLSAGFAHTAQADFITGQVTDATGEAPLEGAIVSVEGLNRSTTTDRFGDYRLNNVPAGDFTVSVSYVGADTVVADVSVPASGTVADFTLGADVRYLDNILVVGSQAAQAGAINQQRASDAIISVIDSDGLGNFPDTTVADSLARVPGLSIENDQGEGRYVSIRGINTDLISASINGVRTPSPEDRRGVLLDGVPSDLLDGIEVQKSLTPDIDGDSLGGVINLKTISAFDRKGRFVRAKVEGRYNEITENLSPKATLTYSETFNDTFGVALSLNFQSLEIEAHNNEAGGWGDENGVFFMDDDYEHRWYELTRERLGVVANFDWRVNENTDLYLRTLVNHYTDDEVRNKFEFKDLDDGAPTSATTSVVPINEIDAEVRLREETRQIQTISAGGISNWDEWTVDYQVSYAYAEEDDSDNHDVAFRFEDIQDNFPGTITFDTSSPETPRISGDASVLDAIYNPANYDLDAFEEENSVNEDTEIAAQFNISRDSIFMNTPVTWKGGLKLRDREKVRDVNLTFNEPDLNLAPFVNDQLLSNWRLPNPQPAWPDAGLTAALRGTFAPGDLDAEGSFFDSNAEDFTIDEKILAGYAMGTFDLGKATVVAGVRIEDTQVDLQGNVVLEDELVIDSVRNISQDYTNILPSVNVKYDFSEKLIGRAAYYAAVVRPAFGEMAPSVVFNDDRDELFIGNSDLKEYEADNFDLALEYYPSGLSVISVGLFHKEIDNAIFPVVVERDEDAAGDLVPLTDFLPTLPVNLAFLDPAILADIEEVATFTNVDSSSITGVEFNYVQGLDFLGGNWEGFLVSGNLTLTDSDATLPEGRSVPFLKQSDTIWNVALGYDKGPWDLRVSANFRGDYLDELEGENLDRTTDDRLLVEASGKYSINDNIQLYIEGKNLTDEPEYYYFGNERRLSQYDEFGRTFIFGARLTY